MALASAARQSSHDSDMVAWEMAESRVGLSGLQGNDQLGPPRVTSVGPIYGNWGKVTPSASPQQSHQPEAQAG